MRQLIKIRLRNPESMYVDSSEATQQQITGKGPITVLLNAFTARLVANNEVDLCDVEINDVIRSGVKISDIPIPELKKYIHNNEVLNNEKIIALAEEKFIADTSSEIILEIDKPVNGSSEKVSNVAE